MEQHRKFYSEIVLLHLMGMFMIFAGHIMQVLGYSVLSEVLITGVPLFLFISGFLVGSNNKTDYNFDWIKKKFKRVLLPYYLLLLTVFSLFCILGKETITAYWIVLGTNLQGLQNFLFLKDLFTPESPLNNGLGHFWFVSIIMLCYFLAYIVVPSNKIKFFVLTLVVLQPFLLMIDITINYVLIFMGGVFWGRYQRPVRLETIIFVSVIACLLLIIRFFSRQYLDGSIIYNLYIAPIANDAIGIWLFFLVFFLREKFNALIDGIATWKVIVWIESIVYEIFLVHHILIKGSWSIFNLIDNTAISIIVIIVIALFLSYILHISCNKILSMSNIYNNEVQRYTSSL